LLFFCVFGFGFGCFLGLCHNFSFVVHTFTGGKLPLV
jgi:hypothetical protein